MKNEYKIQKDKDFTGKRYESYTVEKIITHDNGEVEHRYRVIYPHIDGKIDTIDFEELEFPKPITTEEWDNMPRETRKKWLQI